MKLNCAAIPTGLLESELFGHEKGAFTALLLTRSEEWNWPIEALCFWMKIGDIGVDLQPKLLRVL